MARNRDDHSAIVSKLAANLDHHAPEMEADVIYDVYREIRNGNGSDWSDHHGGFAVLTSHKDVKAAAQDWETFSSAEGAHLPRADGQPMIIPIDFDGAVHTAYRMPLMHLLSRRNIKKIEPYIRSLVRDLLDKFFAAGGGDFVRDVAGPMPINVLGELIGYDDSVRSRIRELTDQLWGVFGEEAEPDAMQKLQQLIFDQVAARRAQPADDMVSPLFEADIQGRLITDSELMMVLQVLAVAGHETTMNAAGNLTHILTSDLSLQKAMRDDRTLIPKYIEESLRLRTPAHIFFRTLTCPYQHGDRSLDKGHKVALAYAAANHDPEVFPEPERFDPERENRTDHLSFGAGPHICPGMTLARLELRILLEALCERPMLELAGEARYSKFEGGHHLGIRYLPLRPVDGA